MIRVKFEQVAKPVTQLEWHLLNEAKYRAGAGYSLNEIKKILSDELDKWKRERDKYKNTSTRINHKFPTLICISNAAGDMVNLQALC